MVKLEVLGGLALNKFHPSKLKVTFFPPATPYKPVDERKYTVNYKDNTGEIFLTIGYCYETGAFYQYDAVFAEWIPQLGQYILKGKVFISDSNFDEQTAKYRFQRMQNDLPIAISAIIYGDRQLFQYYPWLLDCPIYIHFESNDPQFQRILYIGTPRYFLYSTLQTTNS